MSHAIDPRPAGVSEACGLPLLSLIVLAVSTADLIWIVAGELMPKLVLAAAASGMWLVWASIAIRMTMRLQVASASVLLLTAGLCFAMAGAVHDLSFDGLQYHQQAALMLAQGWNPYRDLPLDGPHSIWINGYPKGGWTWGALFPALGLSVELGKSINLILASASFFCVLDLLLVRLALGRGRAFVVATAAAVSPVWATQWPTFTNDGLIASLMLIFVSRAVALALAPARRPGLEMATLALVMVFMPLVKASGAAYGVILWLALALGLAVFVNRPLAWRWTVTGGAAVAMAVTVLGYNPYITNVLRHGHPLYPLEGPGKVDIITPNSPNGVHDHGRAGKLFGSVFSKSHSDFDDTDPRLAPPAFQFKVPGAVHVSELRAFANKTDVRIGGFGPFFGLTLLVATAAITVLLRSRPARRQLCAALFVPAVMLGMSLVFPEPWWARYVPQLWLVPLAVAVAVWTLQANLKLAHRVAWGVALLAFLNAGLVFVVFATGNLLHELDHRAQLASLRGISRSLGPLLVDLGRVPSLGHRLTMHQIDWRPVDDTHACAHWQTIEYTGARVCLTESAGSAFVTQSPFVTRLKRLLGAG